MSDHVPLGRYTLTLDDDPMVHRIIAQATGLESLSFKSSATFLARAQRYEPAGIFVDIQLGADDCGLDLLPQIRARWPYCPVLVVTGNAIDAAIGQALAAGANDFVSKPLNAAELRARFHARALEMSERAGRERLCIGDLRVDIRLARVASDAGVRHLSQADIQLLVYLIHAKGQLVAKEQIKRHLWGELSVSDNALDKKVHAVRRALKELSSEVRLKTAYGKGLVLSVGATQRAAVAEDDRERAA